MRLRYPIFTDPIYHAEKIVEFDSSDVLAIEERRVALFLRGKYWATYVTLKNGAEYALEGQRAAEIETAIRQERESEASG